MTRAFLASLARIADFETNPYDVRALEHSAWDNGDYVLVEVTGATSELYQVESCTGEMLPARPGDQIIGALGVREATLEGVGTYAAVEKGEMHAMTAAGLFGKFTSFAPTLPNPMRVDYRGHILRDGHKVTMRQFALQAEDRAFDIPTILLVGTSMSAGKTVTGRRVCKVLSSAGYDVIAAKLTGAGRYRDIASFKRAGASQVFDFVDVGLPSTVADRYEFRRIIRPLLSHIASLQPDYLVAEAGASPLEPYNGDSAVEELGDNICCTILCASDPYAVVGVTQAFGIIPDLVTGPAANTSAAVDLVHKLAHLPAINVIDRGTLPALRDFLANKLSLDLSNAL